MMPAPDRRQTGVGSALTALWPALGRPIALHRRLVDVCGGVKTALLLSQAIYWSHTGVAVAASGGWFHKSMAEWSRETGLGRRSQECARRRLVALGLIDERLIGLPARLEFRLNLAAVSARLQDDARPVPGVSCRLPESALFGRPLAFHRGLCEIAGSVCAGLLPSALMHATRASLTGPASEAGKDGIVWVERTAVRWMQETGLSRREFEGARKKLAGLGVIEEQVKGVPPTLRIKVDVAALGRLLRGKSSSQAASLGNLHVLDKQGCGKTTSKDASPPQASLAETCKLLCPEGANQVVQNVQDSLAESAISLMNMTRSKTRDMTTNPPPPAVPTRESGAGESRGGGGGSGSSRVEPLHLPEALNEPERAAASVLLQSLPAARAQLLLDELDGQLRNPVRRTPIDNRVAYLRRLRDLDAAGCFVPEAALRVAAGRQRAADEARKRVAERVARDVEYLAGRTPEAIAAREAAMASMRQMVSGGRPHAA